VNTKKIARRDVLEGAVRLAVLAPVAAVLACSKEPDCTDVTSLTPAEASAREAANYLNRAPDPAKQCAKCTFFEAPPQEDACGACKVVKGPIAAKGTCNLFAAKPAG
jgi:hypothetical protein